MVRRPFDMFVRPGGSAPRCAFAACDTFSRISIRLQRLSRASSARTAGRYALHVRERLQHLVPAFHVPASTSVPHIVPSRSSAGQSLIATRAWLACRASLHEGGYHYATFLRWRSRALTDGAPTIFRADLDAALQPSRGLRSSTL